MARFNEGAILKSTTKSSLPCVLIFRHNIFFHRRCRLFVRPAGGRDKAPLKVAVVR